MNESWLDWAEDRTALGKVVVSLEACSESQVAISHFMKRLDAATLKKALEESETLLGKITELDLGGGQEGVSSFECTASLLTGAALSAMTSHPLPLVFASSTCVTGVAAWHNPLAKAGKDLSGAWKQGGKVLSETWKEGGKGLSETWKQGGIDFSRESKNFGRHLAEGWHENAWHASDWWHKNVNGESKSNKSKSFHGEKKIRPGDAPLILTGKTEVVVKNIGNEPILVDIIKTGNGIQRDEVEASITIHPDDSPYTYKHPTPGTSIKISVSCVGKQACKAFIDLDNE